MTYKANRIYKMDLVLIIFFYVINQKPFFFNSPGAKLLASPGEVASIPGAKSLAHSWQKIATT
jgi:hypothetical protein